MREAPRRAGDVKEAALLEAARDLVQRGEFQATPIGQIAQRAGVSRQGFYFYYQSKDELLAQLVTETLYASQPWRETLYDEDWNEPAEFMRRVTAGTVAMWRRHREVLCAAVELAPRSAALLAHWSSAVEETADFLTDMVVSSTTIEALRDPDASRRMMVTLIWMIERNCYIHVFQGSDESDAALAERISDVWIRALGFE
jgi:TetR/AcrR family transcriptional regulator, ethionamide resistance regulator